MIEKTITIFRNKKPKNLKFGLLWFLVFLKNLKKPRFFNSDFYRPGFTARFGKLLVDIRQLDGDRGISSKSYSCLPGLDALERKHQSTKK